MENFTLTPVPKGRNLLTPEAQAVYQERERQDAITRLHDARAILGAAGFHDAAREVASLINQVDKAKANGAPVYVV